MSTNPPIRDTPIQGDPEEEPLLTPSQVARIFAVGPKTVTRWHKHGKLPACFTPGGHRRYRESDVRAFLRTRSGVQPAAA